MARIEECEDSGSGTSVAAAAEIKDDRPLVDQVSQIDTAAAGAVPEAFGRDSSTKGLDSDNNGKKIPDPEGQSIAEDDVFEDAMTEEELRNKSILEAETLKADGNKAYSEKQFQTAIEKYKEAILALPDHDDAKGNRSIYFSNMAICYLHMGEYEKAIESSSNAIELKPDYLKALLRRAQAYEKLDKLEESLKDLKKVIELEPRNKLALADVRRLEPIVEERREKLKEEMMGKLKDLGNSLLGHFGMSVDNFKAVKDPISGSYSISYQQ